MKKALKQILTCEDSEFKPKDKWVRIIGIPLLSFLIPYIFDVREKELEGLYFQTFAITAFYTLLHWEGNRFIILRLRYIYSDYKSTAKRIILQVILTCAFNAFVSLGLCFFINDYIFHSPQKYENAFFYLKISLIATLFISAVYECFYIFSRWERTIKESEQLKRENLISQFEALKSQVNPHFLFNSLNTLITIIPEDQNLAVEFVQKLSKVYRYVLQYKDRELVELQTELDFLRDYVFLNQIRFGKNLVVNFGIPQKMLSTHVAPLAIQMLIENAIKHNVISSERPLTIDIYVEEGNILVVRNNLQKKSVAVESTQVGLQNIITRYKFLTQKVVEVIITATNFEVTLPLLTVEENEK